MTNINKYFIFCILFLFLSGSVMAVKPVTEISTTNENSLSIIYPQNAYRQLGTNVTLAFRVFNYTGFQITDATCKLNVANKDYTSLFNGFLTPNADGAYRTDIDYSLFTAGSYSYTFRCYTDNSAGYIASQIFLTYDGQEPPEDLTPLGVLILIPICLGIILLVGSLALGENHNIMKIFLFLLSLLMPLISFNLSMEVIGNYYFANSSLIDSIGFNVTWFSFVYAVIIMYYLIAFFIWVTRYSAGKRDERLQY